MHRLILFPAVLLLAGSVCLAESETSPRLKLEKGDHVILVGNTLAERMQHFGHFETLLHSRFADRELVVRNLGWSADELTLQPRSRDFQDHGHTLKDHKADVILAFFGFNESFAGEEGLPKFKSDLENFIQETTSTSYNGEHPPQLALISPIAHEDLQKPSLPDGQANNQRLLTYTRAMEEVAKQHNVVFVDLFTPTLKLYEIEKEPMTINGVHLNDTGYLKLAPILDTALFGDRPALSSEQAAMMEQLRKEVDEKNRQFWYDYRAVNGYYIYGGRKEPFGVVNFPREFEILRKMIANRDQRIWQAAKGLPLTDKADDSSVGEFVKIETNFKGVVEITSPEDALKKFEIADGFEINLFASEVEFPDLDNPVQFTFDDKGRMYVCTMPSYPMYLPGTPVNDKVLILEDANGDGKADTSKVFADGLHVPTGLELGDGGLYLAQQPNLMFLKDTDGDDKADVRQLRLHGFDTADSHHSISTFTWGQDGALYFMEGTFHHSQIETPYGPERVANAGVFRYEPLSEKLDIFVSYRFANPWGHIFDRWGQNFVADASGGANYVGAAFSGDVVYPNKHRQMNQFLNKQWRPTAGCEIVSSKHFPESMQGNFLLNNCIGFQGVLQYKFRDDGSGFFADPVEPLLKSNDPNFRPVDIEFGPDGALYLVDWFNPLVGHMQHSLRDPNRDKSHGRIWRITHKGSPLLKPPMIADASIPELLNLLKDDNDRTRYRVRQELRTRDHREVIAALEKWEPALDQNDKEYQHHRLEALWMYQTLDVVNEELLKQLLTSPDYRARAAATRVLCYWRDRVEKPLDLLQQQVHDEHPRVRLEAVRALSFFEGDDVPRAIEVVTESLIHPQDYYLDYTFKETMDTLNQREKK